MNFTISNAMREATRLTGAGHLTEATTAIQRMLGGTTAYSAEAGVTIEGAAEHIGKPLEINATTANPGMLGKVSLKELLRPQARPLSSSNVVMAEGACFGWATYAGSTGSRRYKLYVPSGYQVDVPVPLVVMLHGCTQSPDDFAAGTRMNEAAEVRTFLVAYPEQTCASNMQKCWNWFVERDQHRNVGEPAVIAGITREIMTRHAVDPSRVYVAGLSAGGAMASIMGETYPDLFAAIGVHSGLACGAAHDMPSAFAAMRQGALGISRGGRSATIPAIVFHGDKDTTVNIQNANAVVEQVRGGAALEAASKTITTAVGRGYTRTVRKDAVGCTVVEQWTVHGASHAWAGGSAAGSYTDPRGPDATVEMVRFFLENPNAE